MQQVYQQQLLHQQQQYQQLQAMQAAQKDGVTSPEAPPTNGQTPPTSVQQIPPTATPAVNHVQNGPVAPAGSKAETTPTTQNPDSEQEARKEGEGKTDGMKCCHTRICSLGTDWWRMVITFIYLKRDSLLIVSLKIVFEAVPRKIISCILCKGIIAMGSIS